ncbi:MAG: ABC transporter substrate-binding protein [Deltaproteobacteria bacterium]|nr:ABC transporter substrate-binding protein [Deltaproteobacteria bacterium]MBW2071104.1 ABC transporter substrate-binding protein [Deltaproteobacteria bacterium]
MKIKQYVVWLAVIGLVVGFGLWGCAKKEAAPIKIGGIFDITGPTSAVGKDYAQACKDAEQYINEHGGVNGRKIQLIANDYAYKIPEAVNLYKQYKDVDKVFVIQGWGTGDTNALKPHINKDKIVYISASYDSKLDDPSKTPYNFYVGTSYSDAIRLAMKFIKDTFNEMFPDAGNRAPRVVFIYPDHPYGKAPIPAGKKMAEELGIKVGPDEIVGLRAIDATSQLLHMKEFDPDWAWVGGTTPSTSVIVKDAAKLGLRTKFISNVWGFDENLIKLAGEAGNDRIYGMAPFAFWGEDVPGMKAAMEAAKKTNPEASHTVRYIQGWSAMMVMWEGLKRADKAGELNGPGLKKALETLKDFDTGGLTAPVTFTPTDHRPNTSLRIFKMSNNKLVPVKSVSIEREARFLGW